MNSIKLTDKHLSIIQSALEGYYRMRSGQVHYALDEFYYDKHLSWDEARDIEIFIKSVVFNGEDRRPRLDRDQTFGFNHPEMGNASVAYEILAVIRQFLTVKENGGRFDWSKTWSDDPLKASDEPLPEVEGFKKSEDFEIPRDELLKCLDKKTIEKLWRQSENMNLPAGNGLEIIVSFRVNKPQVEKEKMKLKQKCEECGEHFYVDPEDGPFASCNCGTVEHYWSNEDILEK